MFSAESFFEGIPLKIPFEGPDSDNLLAFKYYDAERVVLGKTMKEWLRFSLAFITLQNSFQYADNVRFVIGTLSVAMVPVRASPDAEGSDFSDMFGEGTIQRPWDDGTESVENAKRRLRVAFEFIKRLGVDYYTFHDRDISPEGKTIEETNAYLDEITDLAKKLQEETGVKLLWGTANLFSHGRYMNGASTNPDLHVFAYAATQVKKCMEVTKKLGGEGYVFWGGREGYQSLLNTNTKLELDHFAAFLKMAADYKKKIGFDGQLLIEPKPREPTKHQYDYDAQTVIGFLKLYGLENDFKLNIEPNHTTLAGHDYEHDIEISSRYGMLGSIDSNTGDVLLGWDTDQFPMDIKKATMVMQVVVRQGGLAPGGLNFDSKVRRESTDVEDIFIAHIGAMDTFARGLLNAVKIVEKGTLPKLVEERYSSWNSDLGKQIEAGQCDFEALEKFIMSKNQKEREPQRVSGKQEKFESIFNTYI